MLNAIGLQNVGLERFIAEKLPYLRQLQLPLIVNIAGETIEDFGYLAQELSRHSAIAALELNISINTLDKHLHHIHIKTKTSSNSELILWIIMNMKDLNIREAEIFVS